VKASRKVSLPLVFFGGMMLYGAWLSIGQKYCFMKIDWKPFDKKETLRQILPYFKQRIWLSVWTLNDRIAIA
jgi:hypothetical protein